jgi:hypothetical protein
MPARHLFMRKLNSARGTFRDHLLANDDLVSKYDSVSWLVWVQHVARIPTLDKEHKLFKYWANRACMLVSFLIALSGNVLEGSYCRA